MLPSPPEGLRHWRLADADALAAAWADPSITEWNRPPTDLSPDEWILGAVERWRRRLALDLVVEAPGTGDVAGEVGLANFTDDPPRAELGVWVAAAHRRQGLAHRAVDAVTRWALAPTPDRSRGTDDTPERATGPPEPGGLGLAQVWARVDEANAAAQRLFAGVGWRRLGARDGNEVWAADRAVLS